QIAFEAPQVVVAVESHDQEHGVDVGCDDLLLGDLARRLPGEAAAAWQDRLDEAALFSRDPAQRHPVADGGKLVPPGGQVPQPSGELGPVLALGGDDPVDVIELDGDAGGNGSGRSERGELRVPRGIPAELPKVDHAN